MFTVITVCQSQRKSSFTGFGDVFMIEELTDEGCYCWKTRLGLQQLGKQDGRGLLQ